MIRELTPFNYFPLAGPVVQANMDIGLCDAVDPADDWQDICDSRLRRASALSALSALGTSFRAGIVLSGNVF